MRAPQDQMRVGDTRFRYYANLVAVLVVAIAVRTIFFSGIFGSDDGTYYRSALKIAQGDWRAASYNGALRYGFNLPAGAFMYLFGNSYVVANLWSICCSLMEIAGVYWLAHSAISRRAAWIAALLLACTPLHVAVATHIHADPIVSAALTLGFVFTYQGMRRDSAVLLFMAGVSIGMVYWAKELAAVCYLAYLPLIWFYRGRWRNIGIVAAATVLMFVLNGALMYAIAGDPLYAVKVVLHAVQHNFIDGGDGGSNSAWYYLPLLFVDLRYVGLLGWGALAALLLWRDAPGATGPRSVKSFLVIWLFGVLLVLSIFPVSLSPLRLTMKQSNYLTLFMAPMVILTGALLACLSNRLVATALAVMLAVALPLAALHQADYRSFTANSKAVAALAAANPHYVVLASTGNSSMGTLWGDHGGYRSRIFAWNDAMSDPKSLTDDIKEGDELVGVFDPQSAAWSTGIAKVTTPPPCWVFMRSIVPQGLGVGNDVAAVLFAVNRVMPTPIAAKLGPRLKTLAEPVPASLYHVPQDNPWCK